MFLNFSSVSANPIQVSLQNFIFKVIKICANIYAENERKAQR